MHNAQDKMIRQWQATRGSVVPVNFLALTIAANNFMASW